MGKDVVVLWILSQLAPYMVVNPSGRTLPEDLIRQHSILPNFSGPHDVWNPSRRKFPTIRISTAQDGRTPRGSNRRIAYCHRTALVETGSRMDDLIYEEFKGTETWNCIFPGRFRKAHFSCIDVGKSGTRHDELLLGEEQ